MNLPPAPSGFPRKLKTVSPDSRALTVTITSDFVCPWCFIGERRLARAIEQIGDIEVHIDWRPFELNAWIPASGMDRREYRITKFGSWERSLTMDAQVAAVGQAEGLSFDFGRMARTHNTFDLHRLMRLAAREGNPNLLAQRFLSAYFLEGADLSDAEQLVQTSVASGLAAQRVRAVLESTEFADEVGTLLARARVEQLEGVPQFEIGGSIISGAQPVSILSRALKLATH